MPQIKDGQGLDVSVPQGQSIAISTVTGTYSATVISGTSAGTVLATASDAGGTFGPYASGATVRLSAGLNSCVSYEVGVAPVVGDAPAAKYSLDPTTGAVVGLVGPDGLGSYTLTSQSDVAVPVTNLSAAAGAAGALTGAYYYSVAFLLSDGTVTPPWPGTGTVVNVTAQRIELTSIPVSASSKVVGRVLLRTVATPIDPNAYFVLATINDNTTTTYSDNAIDGTLTTPANWLGTSSGAMNSDGSRVVGGLSEQSQSLAFGMDSNAGYASVHIGFSAGKDTTTGRRNTSVGVYSLENVTTGYQNTALGTHAGGGITTTSNNTAIGYAAGSATKALGEWNTLIGSEAAGGTGGASVGARNVLVGYRAGYNINTADDVVAIGTNAGQFANASRQLFIDSNGGNRANLAAAQDSGLVYGKGESTAQTQVLHFNAATRVGWGSATVAQLPAAAAGLKGFRAWVGDASVAYTSANVGSTVAGGGANAVPVFCNGTNCVIG